MHMPVKQNDALGTTNRGNPCDSGLCTLCTADCKGNCETWLASLLGRKLLYPREFGNITSGSANVSAEGIGYHALRIAGYPLSLIHISEPTRQVLVSRMPSSA